MTRAPVPRRDRSPPQPPPLRQREASAARVKRRRLDAFVGRPTLSLMMSLLFGAAAVSSDLLESEQSKRFAQRSSPPIGDDRGHARDTSFEGLVGDCGEI